MSGDNQENFEADYAGNADDGDLSSGSSLVAEESVEELAATELGPETALDTEIALERMLSKDPSSYEDEEKPSRVSKSQDDSFTDVARRKENESVCANCFLIVPKLSIDEDTNFCQSCS